MLQKPKTEYTQLEKATKKKAKEQKENGSNPDPDVDAMSSPLAAANAACTVAATKVEEAKLAITTAGAKTFELYGNLLSNKARQPGREL